MSKIRNKNELRFFIMADMMMNRGYFKKPIMMRLRDMFAPDYIMDYLIAMRKTSFYGRSGLKGIYYRLKFRRLGYKLSFSIGPDVFGYGLLIPHYGTIVVGENQIGNYAVLQSSTCISGNQKIIGDGLYLATGAKITTKIVLGDNVTVAANSVVNKSVPQGNVLLAGIPAVIKKESIAWYLRDGAEFCEKVERIENLRVSMGVPLDKKEQVK